MGGPMIPSGIAVLVRGWLHGNSVLVAGPAPALIDTGYHTGAAELVDFLGSHVERGASISSGGGLTVYLTHVHSDHAGGCAEVVRTTGARVWAHARCRDLTEPWNERGLWLDDGVQACPRFAVDAVLAAGDTVHAGSFAFDVIELPGHATGGIGFYEAEHGLLISGDALWENGIGVLRPEVDGEGVFDEALVALERIAALDVAVVIPGHGPPFRDVKGALQRARERVLRFRDHPDRRLQNNVKSLLAFWLLAHPGASQVALDGVLQIALRRRDGRDAGDAAAVSALKKALQASGLLRLEDGRAFPGPAIRQSPG